MVAGERVPRVAAGCARKGSALSQPAPFGNAAARTVNGSSRWSGPSVLQKGSRDLQATAALIRKNAERAIRGSHIANFTSGPRIARFPDLRQWPDAKAGVATRALGKGLSATPAGSASSKSARSAGVFAHPGPRRFRRSRQHAVMSMIVDISAFRRRLPARLASDGWWLDPPPRVVSALSVFAAGSRPVDISKREVRP